MRHTFESLGYQSGFYLSQLFSSTRNNAASSTTPVIPMKQPIRSPTPLFNWGQRPLPAAANHQLLASPNFHNSSPTPTTTSTTNRLGMIPQQSKDETHLFLLPHSSSSSEPRMMEDMMGAADPTADNDIKWPNGLSFFNALTAGRTDDAKLLFHPDSLGTKSADHHHHHHHHHSLNPNSDASSLHSNGAGTGTGANPNDFLSLDNSNNNNHNDNISSHPDNIRKMDNKFKRSFTLPARMTSSSSSTSLDHHHHQQQQQNNPGDYRNHEAAGMYSDVMETFLE